MKSVVKLKLRSFIKFFFLMTKSNDFFVLVWQIGIGIILIIKSQFNIIKCM